MPAVEYWRPGKLLLRFQVNYSQKYCCVMCKIAIAVSIVSMPRPFRFALRSLASTGAMRRLCPHLLLLCFSLVLLTGCDVGTDAATRLASDIKAGTSRLGKEAGTKYSIQHQTPSKLGECDGPYKVQLDKVGALIIWCKDAADHTVSSHSTSYHARFVDTPQTYIVEKPANSILTITLERRDGRAVITDVH